MAGVFLNKLKNKLRSWKVLMAQCASIVPTSVGVCIKTCLIQFTLTKLLCTIITVPGFMTYLAMMFACILNIWINNKVKLVTND